MQHYFTKKLSLGNAAYISNNLALSARNHGCISIYMYKLIKIS